MGLNSLNAANRWVRRSQPINSMYQLQSPKDQWNGDCTFGITITSIAFWSHTTPCDTDESECLFLRIPEQSSSTLDSPYLGYGQSYRALDQH